MALALAAALLSLVAVTGAASASAGTVARHPDFRAQALRAGLTSAQARKLQGKMNHYLAEVGGTQVAINKIDVKPGENLVVPLPGSSRAADPSRTGPTPDANFCYYGDFCAYSGTNFNGTAINMGPCGSYYIPFTGAGSWANNQTKGIEYIFYDRYCNVIYTTPPAYSADKNGNWTYVYSVVNC